MKEQFLLKENIIFLNHGSFGACPKPIFDEYQRLQLELELDPVDFIQNKSNRYLKAAKESLASFIGCKPNDFYFTQNPTMAINTVVRSLNLHPGDEILTSDHEYGAMDKTWNFICKKTGAKYVKQAIHLPITSKEQILQYFWKGYSKRTKVIFLNHISSATALIFPVKEICTRAKELGLVTIIDGAHVPGHIELNIEELDPDFYTGTLHKWMLAPKGSSFLYVKKQFQKEIDPLVVSWGYQSEMPSESQFLDYHEYQGTRDIAAFLSTPKVISFLNDHNWEQQNKNSKELVLSNYKRFCDLMCTDPICPITSEFLGQMASIPIVCEQPLELKKQLLEVYNIQIPIMVLKSNTYIRYSINAYNTQNDLDLLYNALRNILKTTDLIGNSSSL